MNPQANNTTGNPDLNQFTRGYTPCGPYMQNTQPDHYWQVVWAGYHGSLDPEQQLFGPQGNVSFRSIVSTGGGPYDIHIIDGAEYCSLSKYADTIDNGFKYGY